MRCAQDVLRGLPVAAAFHPPNLVRFAAPYGPMTGPADPIPGPIDLDLGRVLPSVEALVLIQDHTSEQIMIPDLPTVTLDDARGWMRLAHLLRKGSVFAKWTPFEVESSEASAAVGEPPAQRSVRLPCTVHHNGGDITLGTVRYELASAQIESVTPAEAGIVRVRFVPGGGSDRDASLRTTRHR
jgi:hypothetical protein